MSKAKHKSFRKVLKVERFEKREGVMTVPVTIVTWAIAESENSKSIFTRHLGVTVYVGNNPKHSGVEAWISSTSFRVPKNLENSDYYDSVRSRTSKAYTHALYSYLGGTTREGTVVWYHGGDGMLEDSITGLRHHFYACNFVGADSPYAELVKNVKVSRGDKLTYMIHKDPFVSTHCGATELKVK